LKPSPEKPKLYSIGAVIYKEGDVSKYLYIVIDGEVEISAIFKIPKVKNGVQEKVIDNQFNWDLMKGKQKYKTQRITVFFLCISVIPSFANYEDIKHLGSRKS